MSRVAVGLLLLVASGCATYITPPAAPPAPVAVYMLVDGRHSSLLLPDATGEELIEYSFGDWNWYALGRTDWYRAFPTLFWPTPGTLGRRTVEPEVLEGLQVYRIVVDRSSVQALLEHLDARYRRNIETLLPAERYGLAFVRDDESFHMFHCCNQAVGGWLRELGCRVHGPSITSDFVLKSPPEP